MRECIGGSRCVYNANSPQLNEEDMWRCIQSAGSAAQLLFFLKKKGKEKREKKERWRSSNDEDTTTNNAVSFRLDSIRFDSILFYSGGKQSCLD